MSTDLAGSEADRQSLPPLPPPATTTQARPPKSAAVAVLLSLFPGLGQVYNGQPAKALVFFFAWVGSIYGSIDIHPLPFALLIPFVYLYNLVDASRSATLINARIAGGIKELEEETVESPAWGASLMGLGLVLLMHNLGWLDLTSLQRFWPVLLIVAGGLLLRGSIRRGKHRETGDGSSL